MAAGMPKAKRKPLTIFRLCPCYIEFLQSVCLLNNGLEHSRSNPVFEIHSFPESSIESSIFESIENKQINADGVHESMISPFSFDLFFFVAFVCPSNVFVCVCTFAYVNVTNLTLPYDLSGKP